VSRLSRALILGEGLPLDRQRLLVRLHVAPRLLRQPVRLLLVHRLRQEAKSKIPPTPKQYPWRNRKSFRSTDLSLRRTASLRTGETLVFRPSPK